MNREAHSLGITTVLDTDTGDLDLLGTLAPLVSNLILSMPALQAITRGNEAEPSLKACRC